MIPGDNRVVDPEGDGEHRPQKHPRIGDHEIEADPQQQTRRGIGVEAVEEVAEDACHSIFLHYLLL